MSEQPPRNLMIPPQGGVVRDLLTRIKLILRLMGDRRVNFFLKLLPLASFAYLLIPLDLAPVITLPVIGVLDDVAVLWLGSTLFLELCPPAVVQEHLQKVTVNERLTDRSGEVVDGEARDVSDRPGDGA